MKLINFYGKKVKIVDIDNRTWEGTVTDYIYAEDNEPEIESIIIDTQNIKAIEFTKAEIKAIEKV